MNELERKVFTESMKTVRMIKLVVSKGSFMHNPVEYYNSRMDALKERLLQKYSKDDVEAAFEKYALPLARLDTSF